MCICPGQDSSFNKAAECSRTWTNVLHFFRTDIFPPVTAGYDWRWQHFSGKTDIWVFCAFLLILSYVSLGLRTLSLPCRPGEGSREDYLVPWEFPLVSSTVKPCRQLPLPRWGSELECLLGAAGTTRLWLGPYAVQTEVLLCPQLEPPTGSLSHRTVVGFLCTNKDPKNRWHRRIQIGTSGNFETASIDLHPTDHPLSMICLHWCCTDEQQHF